jgi:hypothetical protein
MLIPGVSASLPDDDAGIVDRLCHSKDFEIALRKVTKGVEIKHLVVDVKERVFGVVVRRRGSDDHSGCVGTLPADAAGRACVSTECSQIGDAVAQLRFRAGENDDEEEYCCKSDSLSRFHGEIDVLRNSGVQRTARVGKNKNYLSKK